MDNTVLFVKIPAKFLERIREEGRRLRYSWNTREASGILLGTYFSKDCIIDVSEMYEDFPMRSIEGDKFFGKLYDGLIYALNFYNYFLQELGTIKMDIKLKKEGLRSGIVYYHSHSDESSWSPTDIESLKDPFEFPNADLLYIVDRDEFEVLNNDMKNVEILPKNRYYIKVELKNGDIYESMISNSKIFGPFRPGIENLFWRPCDLYHGLIGEELKTSFDNVMHFEIKREDGYTICQL